MSEANQTVFSIEALIGRAFVQQKDDQQIHLVAMSLGDKMGKVKDLGELPYLAMMDKDGNTKLIAPSLIHQLQDGAEHKGMRMLTPEEQEAYAAQVNDEMKADEAKADEAKPAGLVLSNATIGDPATAPGATAATSEQAAPFVAVTKKSVAHTIYAADREAGLARKDTIAKFKTQLGMSDQGASTYYQNFKSGKWTA